MNMKALCNVMIKSNYIKFLKWEKKTIEAETIKS